MTLPLAALLQGAVAGGPTGQTYVDDVFSTYLYTGNGSTQTITNGIDLAGKGGMVWTKKRSGAYSHYLYDTSRGVNVSLNSDDTSANDSGANELTAFNATGFDLGTSANVNGNTATYVSWTFRKAPKFFDVVTYTGNGVAGRTIAHSLGQSVGMLVIKRTDAGGSDWAVWHRGAPTLGGRLNQTDVFETGYYSAWVHSTQPSDTVFTVSADGSVNLNGATYVAYLFAHDTGTDGIIQCGSFTANGGGSNLDIELGWEPQYVLMKNVSVSNDWHVFDTMRGFGASRPISILRANTPGMEQAETGSDYFGVYQTGFRTLVSSGGFSYAAGNNIVYLAIRRPNKPPTVGTQVYCGNISSAATGTAITTGFAVDMQMLFDRTSAGAWNTTVVDRLRGVSSTTTTLGKNLFTSSTNAEADTYNASRNWNPTGFEMPNSFGGESMVFESFRRAPGVFDQVCYTGTGAAHTEAHNLGVVPELMIVKKRSGADAWYVYGGVATDYLILNTTAATAALSTIWNDTAPTSSVFTVGTHDDVNQSTGTFVAYLFATKAGISKVGSYTGNGSNQTINCGFTTGARFILIKRTDFTGNWFVWDSVRGIVAGNDPHLSLNTTAAEVTTDDSIDPDTSGFIVNQDAATNINVNAATYIYLSLA